MVNRLHLLPNDFPARCCRHKNGFFSPNWIRSRDSPRPVQCSNQISDANSFDCLVRTGGHADWRPLGNTKLPGSALIFHEVVVVIVETKLERCAGRKCPGFFLLIPVSFPREPFLRHGDQAAGHHQLREGPAQDECGVAGLLDVLKGCCKENSRFAGARCAAEKRLPAVVGKELSLLARRELHALAVDDLVDFWNERVFVNRALDDLGLPRHLHLKGSRRDDLRGILLRWLLRACHWLTRFASLARLDFAGRIRGTHPQNQGSWRGHQ